jgi:predicted TIM-barrel fold metal-dependent hydrolase
MDYQLISTDDHMQEPRDLWTRRLSKTKWGKRIPEVRPLPDGRDCWHIWDKPFFKYGNPMIGAVNGVMPERRSAKTWDEIPAKAYVPAERIKAMAEDGVDVHTFFGNVTGIAGNTFSNPEFADEQFRIECIQAYNDFQIDDFATPFPGRFITIGVVPLWDAGKAVAEASRMAKRGIKALAFAFPQQYGYPHICDTHWDPLWAFAQEAKLSVNFHIGSGGGMGITADAWQGNNMKIQAAERSTRAVAANVDVMTTLLFSQIMERFPKLKVVSSESGLGWVPYLLETADHHWSQAKLAKQGMPLKPSDYFKRQCYVNYWFESTGLKLMKVSGIGIDNVMWSSDYPHPTGTWPDSKSYIERAMAEAGLDAAERRKVLVDNARSVFNL